MSEPSVDPPTIFPSYSFSPFLSSSIPLLSSTQLAVVIFSKSPGTGAANGWPHVIPLGRWPCWTSANSMKITRERIEWAWRRVGWPRISANVNDSTQRWRRGSG